jgi:hypothetical protein
MVLALARQVAGGVDVLGCAVGGEPGGRKGIAQALFDQADGRVGDVDADPTPPQLFRREMLVVVYADTPRSERDDLGRKANLTDANLDHAAQV